MKNITIILQVLKKSAVSLKPLEDETSLDAVKSIL